MTDISVKDFMQDAADLAGRAISQDKLGNHDVAVYFYRESINLLNRTRGELHRRHQEADQQHAVAISERICSIETKIQEYQRRINELETISKRKQEQEIEKPKKSDDELDLERAKFLVSQALEEDECGNDGEAVKLYTEAVQLCLQTKRERKIDAQLARQIESLAKQALDRAEIIKGVRGTNISDNSNSSTHRPEFSRMQASAGVDENEGTPSTESKTLIVPGKGGYTEEEKKVLLSTSRVNGVDYLPFMQVDLQEKFAFPLPFSDQDGLLTLSPKQKKNFARWARPSEIWSNPRMFERIDCFSIKQTIVSDCSVVASLSISALYEKRFGKKLITPIIYPQNRNGVPVYNPCGKYLVKLNVNGVWRKVIIDDLLPVGRHGELLCSYSNNKGELWVSLLEKAYLKVMGGYDFPGSNSNIDLHALTGWIPERLSINGKESQTEFNKEKAFQKMHSRLHKGDVLITVATGEMTSQEEERTGLVATHAYAVLDIQERLGVRLFLLKNPWSHVRWKGNYSELDVVHWTEEMKKEFKYDPNSASMFDNGVFWIDYDSLIHFYDVIYMSWNPTLFSYTYCVHRTWDSGSGPVKDVYNIGENPQYRLEVRSQSSSAVWCVLTRHITELEDFKYNREYITLLVYDTDGKRVYYPHDPPPIIDGVRINSPHYLCKIILPSAVSKRYTLVVSQYEKMKTIHYTLRAYSSCPFSLQEIKNPCKYTKQVTGEWKGITAGGCANHPNTYKNNPCYQITFKSALNGHTMLVELRGPKVYDVGFDIMCSNVVDVKAPGFFNKKSSGPFRPGFVILECENVPSGVYNVIPATFKPNCEGPFFLKVQCTSEFSLKLL
ncbi:unnamed protein product [Orchesella dallaii]|uniref:Calpain catalytic domain-containing protein n=1 Tax=Orchesella dallaii TaxID=48710 RepID=A0ABP1QFW4_9HEXA